MWLIISVASCCVLGNILVLYCGFQFLHKDLVMTVLYVNVRLSYSLFLKKKKKLAFSSKWVPLSSSKVTWKYEEKSLCTVCAVGCGVLAPELWGWPGRRPVSGSLTLALRGRAVCSHHTTLICCFFLLAYYFIRNLCILSLRKTLVS